MSTEPQTATVTVELPPTPEPEPEPETEIILIQQEPELLPEQVRAIAAEEAAAQRAEMQEDLNLQAQIQAQGQQIEELRNLLLASQAQPLPETEVEEVEPETESLPPAAAEPEGHPLL